VYFICPGGDCGRRVSILYFIQGVFLCRRCNRLAYDTQCQDARGRARRREDKARKRLGYEQWSAFTVAHAAKPKGMWRTTFSRLHRAALAADGAANTAHAVRLVKLIGRIDRRPGRVR
jgi:hypothetical protein